LPSELNECSGIDELVDGKYLMHNDSGNPNEVFIVDTTCAIQKRIIVRNMQNNDWEDISLDSAGNLYIGDFGNNSQNRKNLRIGIIANLVSEIKDTVEAKFIEFKFEDQNEFPPPASRMTFDCEALGFYGDSLYMITKNWSAPFSGQAKLYVLPALPGNYTAHLVDSTNLGTVKEIAWVTGIDIKYNRMILIGSAYAWSFHFTDLPRFDSLIKRYEVFPISQKEGISFNGDGALITDESTGGFGSMYELGFDQVLSSELLYQKPINLHYVNGGISIDIGLRILDKCELWSIDGHLIWGGSPKNINGKIVLKWSDFYATKGIYVVKLIDEKGSTFVTQIAITEN
jgi:hypothetical protein